jgi:hypothetical protein
MRLPFVDCHVLRIHIGNHGGHDCDRHDRCCISMCLVLMAQIAVVATDFYVLSMLNALDNRHTHGAFCAHPSPRGRLSVDCRVRRVQLGGHGSHDRNPCDDCHIVIVVSTAMRPSSRLPSCSRLFLNVLAQQSLLARRLLRACWFALATSIYRRCSYRRRSSPTLLLSSSLAIDVVAVVATCD